MNDKREIAGIGDPYGAIAVWYFDANRDPSKFLKIFEGVAPEVQGMVWTQEGYVPDGEPEEPISFLTEFALDLRIQLP